MPEHVWYRTLRADAYMYCYARFLSDPTAMKNRVDCRKVRCRFPNTNTRQVVRNRISYSIPCLSTLLPALLIFRLPSAFGAGLLQARPHFCDIRDVQRQQNGQGRVLLRVEFCYDLSRKVFLCRKKTRIFVVLFCDFRVTEYSVAEFGNNGIVVFARQLFYVSDVHPAALVL